MLLKSSHSVIVSEKTEDASGHIWSYCPLLEHHMMLHTKTFSDFNLISICFTLNLEEAFSFSPVTSPFSTEGPLSSMWSKNCQSEPQSIFSLQCFAQAVEMRSSLCYPGSKFKPKVKAGGEASELLSDHQLPLLPTEATRWQCDNLDTIKCYWALLSLVQRISKTVESTFRLPWWLRW